MCLHLERCGLDKDSVVLDGFGCAFFHSGDEVETGDGLFLLEVYDKVVGEGHALVGAPIGAFLLVEGFGAVLVAGDDILIIGIEYGPGIAGDGFAIGIPQIDFGYATIFAVPMAVEGLDAEIAAGYGLVELDKLQSVAWLHGTRHDGRLVAEVERLSFLTMGGRHLNLQFVQFGNVLSPDYGFLRSGNVEYNDFVLAFLQPAAGHIECLLRTYTPDAAHSMSVHPYLSLAPGLEVEEGVAHFLQVEVAAVVASAEDKVFALSGKAIAAAHYRSVQFLLRGGILFLLFKGVDGGIVVVGDGSAIPTVGGEGNLRFVNAAKMGVHGCIDDG